jgi:endo-1,4-beta-xylanase
MYVAGHTLFIAGANSAKVDVFDMQGRPVFSAKNVKGSIDLKDVSEGLYMVRVRDGSANLTKRIAIK